MRTLLCLALLATLSSPAAAQDAQAEEPIFCAFAAQELPADQADRFCATIQNEPENYAAHLVAINRALEQVSYRSPFNAMLLTMRGGALAETGDENEAAKTFEQAVARYPGLTPVLLTAITTLAYTAHADAAAHYWITLAETDPENARLLPGQWLSDLVSRLERVGNLDQVFLLVDTLDAIGYDGGNPFARSTVAIITLDSALRNGQLPAARAAARRLGDPDSLVAVAADNFYTPLRGDLGWETAEQRQASVREWADALVLLASADSAQAGLMMGELLPHVGPEQMLAAYDAQLQHGLQTLTDQQALFNLAYWLAPLANAHVLQGDVAGAEQIYQAALAAFAPFDNVARFNADANYGRMLQQAGRNADALAVIERGIAQLTELDRSNPALLPMHAVRVRALHGLDQLERTDASLAIVRAAAGSDFTITVNTLLHIAEYDEARDLVLARLRHPYDYRIAVDFLQPSIEAFPTPDTIARETLLDRLRSDRQVLAALQDRGRLLDQGPIRLQGFDLPVLDLTAVPPGY